MIKNNSDILSIHYLLKGLSLIFKSPKLLFLSIIYFFIQIFVLIFAIIIVNNNLNIFFLKIFNFNPDSLTDWYAYYPGLLLYYLIGLLCFILLYFFMTFILQPLLFPFNLHFVKKSHEQLGVDFKQIQKEKKKNSLWIEFKIEIKKYIFYILLFLLPLPLIIIPGIGIAGYYFITIIISTYILTYEFLDYSYILFGDSSSLKLRMNNIFKRYFLWLSFGGGVYFIVAIPVINLFFTPIILSGSAILYYEKFHSLK